MNKRRWLYALILTGLLVIGITGGAVLAHGGGENGDSPVKSFASRVAGILGLNESQVQDAFDQARTEMQDEALQAKLDKMVESGRLTQEEADEYKEWYDSRPDTLTPGFGGRKFHFGQGFGSRRFHHGMGMWDKAPQSESIESNATTF
ncbi:MAG: hypothetical protein O7E55_08030 [Chloroflexi bacterium]|nr:hypothetical protein [Chloroflexota bacterium]